MSVIKWTEALEIGIESLDVQHRFLIDVINELHLAVKHNEGNEVLLPMIEKLHDYADTHFSEEEELLEKHDFAGKLDHVQEHNEFIAKLDELKRKCESSGEALTIDIRNYLLSWFFHHIKVCDMEYKAFFQQIQVIAK